MYVLIFYNINSTGLDEAKWMKFVNEYPDFPLKPANSSAGYTNHAHPSAVTEAKLWALVLVNFPASLAPMLPIICVLGFDVFKQPWFKKGITISFLIGFGVDIIRVGVLMYMPEGREPAYTLTRYVTLINNTLSMTIYMIFAYAKILIPDGNCNLHCRYCCNNAGSNIASMVIGGVLFPVLVFPVFTSPNTPAVVRTLIAMFGANIVFFAVYALGRTSAFKVERLPGHRGWGVVYFATVVSAIFGRLMLTGLAGSTATAGTSLAKRGGMIAAIVGVDALRFCTRIFTGTQDRLCLKYVCPADASKVAPAIKAEAAPSPSPSPVPTDGEASKKSMMNRGQSVKEAAKSRTSSMAVRLGTTEFQNECYVLIAHTDIVASFYCCFNVFLIEHLVAFDGHPTLTMGVCFTSFVINFMIQFCSQVFFMFFYILRQSRVTNMQFHANVDDELRHMFMMLTVVVLQLGPWLCTTSNNVIMNNIFLAGQGA